MKKGQKGTSNGANGAGEDGITAATILAKIEHEPDPNLEKALNKSQLLLPSSLSKTKKDAAALQNSINKENARISKLGKEEIVNEIMRRLEADAVGEGSLIDLEDIHNIGVCLIRNFCSIEATASELGLHPARLKNLIVKSDELQVYYEIAHTGIKSLTDREVIEGLRNGNENFVKMVFNKMYAGRNKGAYNIAEIGTIGYDDPLAQRLAAATEEDRRQSQVKVEFNFVQKEVRQTYGEVESADTVLDGEYEMVKEDDKSIQSTPSDSEEN